MRHKTKIAFCIPNLDIGGCGTVFANTVDELLKNPGLDITIITHAKVREPLYAKWFESHPDLQVYTYYPLCNWFEDLAPKCHGILKLIRKITFSLYKKFRRFLWKNKFKDIDIFIDYKNFEFFKELRNINKPKIAWTHSALSYFESSNTPARLPIYTKIVGITDEFVNDFKQKYPKYADKIVRIYNPMNIDSVRQKAKIKKTSPGKYFCHVSRLVAGKDIKTLLDAFDIFYKSNKNVKLYIIGDGDKSDEFKLYAGKLKSNKNITFTGSLTNPYTVMRGAIANILSSEYEGLPTVILESVILGVPCISSDCKNGPREILLNGRGGMLFDIGNAKQLAEKMTFVFEHPKEAKKLSDIATKELNRFKPETIAKQICTLIEASINQEDII